MINKGIDLDRILYLSIDQINSLPHANIENLISTFVESIHDRYPATLDKELFISSMKHKKMKIGQKLEK